MIEKVGHIKNPLTVISVFAGIAEISGTAVLPFIDIQNQATYIWFLMLFPPFLVGIFFATLNWNHKALYAPSDYQNEDNFINPLGKSTSQERVLKLEEEVNEVVSDITITTKPYEPSAHSNDAPLAADDHGNAMPELSEVHHNIIAETRPTYTNNNTQDPPTKKHITNSHGALLDLPHSSDITTSRLERSRLTADIKITEDLAIQRVEELTGLNFARNAKFSTSTGRNILFDAACLGSRHLSALEVKLFRTSYYNRARIDKILNDCQIIVDEGLFNTQNFTLYLVIVTTTEDTELQRLHDKILKHVQDYNFDVQLHIMTMQDLEL